MSPAVRTASRQLAEQAWKTALVKRITEEERAARHVRKAAPDMLTALRACVTWFGTHTDAQSRRVIAQARAAIWKAEGCR